MKRLIAVLGIGVMASYLRFGPCLWSSSSRLWSPCRFSGQPTMPVEPKLDPAGVELLREGLQLERARRQRWDAKHKAAQAAWAAMPPGPDADAALMAFERDKALEYAHRQEIDARHLRLRKKGWL